MGEAREARGGDRRRAVDSGRVGVGGRGKGRHVGPVWR
jgi:hypothetical protein